MTIERIAEYALSLPSHDRAILADQLAESLDPAEDSLIKTLWVDEANRRQRDVRTGKIQTIPGPEPLARVRGNFVVFPLAPAFGRVDPPKGRG